MVPIESVVFDKALIENIPFGAINLSIHNGYSIWGENENGNRLLEIVLKLIQNSNDMGIVLCSILRQVIVTCDISILVKELGNQLNEPWRVSSDGVIGQALFWGDGTIESTFGVIIISQDIAVDLISENSGVKDLALGLLIHELAHIHDYFYYLINYGPNPTPTQDDWASHRLFFARSLWGEYFAESVAYPYLKTISFQHNIDLSVRLIENGVKQIKNEIFAFGSHKIVAKVWAKAEFELSSVFNQLGRSLALLVSDKMITGNEDIINHFLFEIYSISSDWEQIIRNLLIVLETSEQKLDQRIIDSIGEQVDNAFRIVGLEPYKNKS